MSNQEPSQSPGKNFFSTLPGVITALAGLITAIGGFLLVLNKTGCTNSKNIIQNKTEQNDTITENNKNENSKDSALNKYGNIFYSPTEIKHITRHLVYKIKEANIETLPGKEIVLTLKIKCVNDSKYEYNFYSNYIRVVIGEDKYSSDPYSASGGYQAVDAVSFKDLEYNYKLPAGTKKFNLVFYDESTEIGSSSFAIK